MRANEAQKFTLPASEQLTIPELGGDGIVTVRGIGYGLRIEIGTDPRSALRAALLAEATVVGDDGEPVMTAESWDAFGQAHEDRYLEVLKVARRVSGFDAADVKKS